jgi:hypothetical protein
MPPDGVYEGSRDKCPGCPACKPAKHDDAAFREKVKRLCDWCNDAIDWVELDATRHINTDKGRDLAREVLAMMDKP